MGLKRIIRSQFLDTIEYVDQSNKVLVYKYNRPSEDNEIKNGSQIIVRESQVAVFLHRGLLADILEPGTWTLNTDNLPILSTLSAIGHFFNSPIKADLYYISTKQFIGNKWATRNPVILRDPNLNLVRVRCFGQYAFRIVNPEAFMKEVFGTKGLVLTWDIINYFSAMMAEAFATVLAEKNISVFDLASEYRNIANEMVQILNQSTITIGVEFSNIVIENISLPDEVEKLIDEQSAISLAKTDMDSFMKYQSARAMRDASKQNSGLAGLGAGAVAAQKMIGSFSDGDVDKTSDLVTKLKDLKMLLDEGILTQEEFDSKKKEILNL